MIRHRILAPLVFLGLASLFLPARPGLTQEAAPTPAYSPNPLAGVPSSAMTSFLARPLFSPSRRQASSLPVAQPLQVLPRPPEAPSTANLRLLGTVERPEGRIALVRDGTRGTVASLREGETIERWRVGEIGATRIVLEHDDARAVLEMFQPNPARAAPARRSAATQTGSPPVAGSNAQPLATPSPGGVASHPATGAVPPGTLSGTAAAEAAASSPHRLTFGGTPTTAR